MKQPTSKKMQFRRLALLAGLSTSVVGILIAESKPDTSKVITASAEKTDVVAIPQGEQGFESHIRPFFKKHCVKCHGPEKSKGKITVHSLAGDLTAGQELERWEKILEAVEYKDMPPEDEESQPTDPEREAVTQWIEDGMRSYVEKASQIPTATTTRRLTNFEYQNTMRDLLGFELELTKDLSADPKKPYHFNNNAKFMMIGPDQLLRYKEAARKAMRSAIVNPEKPKVHRKLETMAERGGRGVALSPNGITVYGGSGPARPSVGISSFPETGEFRIRLKAAAVLPNNYKEVPLNVVMGTELKGDSRSGLYHTVGNAILTNTTDNYRDIEFRGRIENIPVQPGRTTKRGKSAPSIRITLQNLFDNGQLNDHRKSGFDTSWNSEVPRIMIKSLEFEAPVIDVWPPEHHTRILFDSPLRESNPKAYVREVIERFMIKAFRRPVATSEVNQYVEIYKLYKEEFETLEEAMRETLSMVLISPQFLYHTEIKNESSDAVKQYDMASKLSYFLWGSMPDQELFDLAAAGKLTDPAVIETQVQRLLKDERSADFIENFTTQWLSIAKMKTVSINKDLFPRFLYTVHLGQNFGHEILFRPTIRDHMQKETVGFMRELIKRNASILNIVDSDFAYLNERLAIHYGVEGVSGSHFRVVPIKPEDRLGGLLTHGSVLIGNSTGSAPHPIYRAVWLREAILGDEVKPPPADIPALEETAGKSVDNAKSIKDLLALHRTKESCNDCHVRLDPWGIPFERYNAIGQFQPLVPKDGVKVEKLRITKFKNHENYNKYLKSIFTEKVDAKARVPHGPEVDGMRDLKKYLIKDRKEDIVKNMIRRLLNYGIARELTYRDRFQVDELYEITKANDYKISDLIVSICKSEIFTGIRTNKK